MKKILIFILLLSSQAYATQFFNATSPWYTQIPASPTLDSQSTDKVEDILCFTTSFENYPTSGPACSGNAKGFYPASSVTIWESTNSDPDQTIVPWDCAVAIYNGSTTTSCTTDVYNYQKQGWDHLKIPAGAAPAGNGTASGNGNLACFPNTSSKVSTLPECRNAGDGFIAVYNSSYEWDGGGCVYFPSDYGTVALRDKYTCRYFRRWDRTGLGYINPDDGLGGPVFSKIPLMIGTLTYADYVAGTVDHALHFAYSGAPWPAHWLVSPPVSYIQQGGTVCEQVSGCIYPNLYGGYYARSPSLTGTQPLMGGDRLFLPSSASCSGLSGLQLLICNTLKTYGMIFTINAGRQYNQIIVENATGKAYESTWNGIINATNGYMRGIPWSSMQVTVPLGSNTACTSDTTAPTAPTGVTATTVSATSISLSWTKSTDNCNVTRYSIESCSGVACSDFAEVGSTNTEVSFQDLSLQCGTTYRYRIQASDAAANNSSYSSTVSATTSACPSTPYNLVPPTALLTWTTNCDDYVTAGATAMAIGTDANAYVLVDYLGWYVCVKVIDTEIITPPTITHDNLAQYPNYDMVIFLIDSDGSGTSADWEFRITPDGSTADYGSNVLATNLLRYRKATVNNEPGNYTVKFAIPWKAMGYTTSTRPKTGDSIYFDILVWKKTKDTISQVQLCNNDGASGWNPAGFCVGTFTDIKQWIRLTE